MSLREFWADREKSAASFFGADGAHKSSHKERNKSPVNIQKSQSDARGTLAPRFTHTKYDFSRRIFGKPFRVSLVTLDR